MDGDRVAAFDCGEREDEEVGDVGEEVGENDKGHGGVDDSGEVLVWVEEFPDHVVGLDEAQ